MTLTNKQTDQEKTRKIRSFVVRSARMTEGQQQAFNAHMEKWAIPETPRSITSENHFNNSHDLTLEIGFGMGDSLAQMASESPDINFVGIEVHQPGIGRLLNLVEKAEISNVRVLHGDAVEILDNRFPVNSLSRVNIYFPDPWHKTKHHKRRLIQHDFVKLITSRLAENGMLHIATDWQPYAAHCLKILSEHKALVNIAGDRVYSDANKLGRPETKFERRGKKLGHGVWDIALKKTSLASKEP